MLGQSPQMALYCMQYQCPANNRLHPILPHVWSPSENASGAYVRLTEPTTIDTITLFSRIEAEPGWRVYPSQGENGIQTEGWWESPWKTVWAWRQSVASLPSSTTRQSQETPDSTERAVPDPHQTFQCQLSNSKHIRKHSQKWSFNRFQPYMTTIRVKAVFVQYCGRLSCKGSGNVAPHCNTIGRSGTEGLKSNVIMNAWPQGCIYFCPLIQGMGQQCRQQQSGEGSFNPLDAMGICSRNLCIKY